MSAPTTFPCAALHLNLVADDDSTCSEYENKLDSDYSLSDIEEGLDDEIDDVPLTTASMDDLNFLENQSDDGVAGTVLCDGEKIESLESRGIKLGHLSFSTSSIDSSKVKMRDMSRRKSKRLSARLSAAKYGAIELRDLIENDEKVTVSSAKVRSKNTRFSLESHSDAETSASSTDQHRNGSIDISPTIECVQYFSQSPSSEVASAAVKKWKHYKRAMAAYRQSAEKSHDETRNPSAKSFPFLSLPLRRPLNEELDKGRLLGHSSDSPVKVSHNENNNVNGGTSSIFQPAVSDDLNFDYRSLRRTTVQKQQNRRSRIDQLKINDFKRFSIESDIITDIDTLAGFDEKTEISNFVPRRLSRVGDKSTKESSSNSEVNVPEKIVWCHYNNYFKPKSDMRLTPLRDLKASMNGLGKKTMKSRSSVDLSASPPENSDVNLRDKKLIKKRNFSSSTLTLHRHHKPRASSPALTNDAYKYHTIASSKRLTKIFRRQHKKATEMEKEKQRSNSTEHSDTPTDLASPISDGQTVTDIADSMRKGTPSLSSNNHTSSEDVSSKPKRFSKKRMSNKFRFSRSLPQLQVIENGKLPSPLYDGDMPVAGHYRLLSERKSADSVLDKMSKLELNQEAGFFSSLSRRRLSGPFRKKKVFRTSKRSIKACDIVHTQLNSNNSNNRSLANLDLCFQPFAPDFDSTRRSVAQCNVNAFDTCLFCQEMCIDAADLDESYEANSSVKTISRCNCIDFHSQPCLKHLKNPSRAGSMKSHHCSVITGKRALNSFSGLAY